MNIYKILDSMTTYLSEGIAWIFRPSNDSYPAIGVQPYTGEPYTGGSDSDWW